MAYADRVKESSTSTGTGSLSLAGAASGFRTFAAGFTVGATMPYAISDALGNWEIGTGTLSALTTLARTTVLASSNSNALVNFPAGSKDVFCTLAADNIARGMVNKDDAGFDIVLCAGQSNMVGYGNTANAAIDCADSRVYQFGSASSDGATYQQIISGADPLKNSDNTAGLGPATAFAKAYASTIPTNRRVLIVPICIGGTYIIGGTWQSGSPGGSLYESAISQANAAIAKAILHYPNSRFVGTVWLQGENDGDNGQSQANYATALKAVIAGFRSRITGAASSWFVIAGMVPEAITNRTGLAAIALAHQQVATEVSQCTYVAGPSGYTSDTLHYQAPGARILGARLGQAVYAASIYSAGPPPAVTGVTMTGPTSGVASTASSNFSVGVTPVGGTITGTVVVTPNDASGGGTFSPTSVSLSSGTPSGTFTYTPNSTVTTRTVSITNNGGLTPPSNISYSVTAAATVPGAPTIGTATGGDASASVTFTAPASNGGAAITGYTVTSTPGNITATGASSPITITGLTNATAYTFTVKATNSVGTGSASAASNSVTPAAAVATTAPVRLGALVAFTEGGTAPNYVYTGTNAVNSYSGVQGGISTTALQSGTDGSMSMTCSSGGQPMIGVTTSATVTSYTSLPYALWANDTSGIYNHIDGGTPSASGLTNSVSYAAGDIMRLRRVGTTLIAEVARTATPTTFTPIYTWTGVPTTAYKFQCSILGSSNISALTGTGLA